MLQPGAQAMSAGTDTTILASVKGLGEARTSGNVPIKQDDADEDTINEVLGKTKYQNKTRHAFDGVSAETELSEQQIK